MDLGIKGKKALVCASSKGLGLGCAEHLAAAGVDLVMNARGAEALEASAERLRSTYGVNIVTVAADVATQEGQAEVIKAAQGVDILVNNAGGPPPGMWTDWEREDFIKALDANMLAPIALIKALVPDMMDRGWGRVVNGLLANLLDLHRQPLQVLMAVAPRGSDRARGPSPPKAGALARIPPSP